MSEATLTAKDRDGGGFWGCCGCGSAPEEKDPNDKDKPKTKRPRYTRITQQELGACKPVFTKTAVTLIFVLVAIVFIPIGAVCLAYGLRAKEVVYRYDDQCIPAGADGQAYLWQNANDTNALTCNITVPVDKDLIGTVYVYYEIHGLYQNYRRYVRSHLDLQLANVDNYQQYISSQTQAQSCVPWINYPLNGQQINPCGLVAWSYFNDSYALTQLPVNGPPRSLSISPDGIAFNVDVTYRFANYTPQNFNPTVNQYRGGATIQGTVHDDQRFMVWMRLAHMPNFRKLWGIMQNQNIRAGDSLQLTVTNQYNTYSFSGSKYLVLSTTTWLGGHTIFLGVAYLVTGGISLLFCIIYLIVVLAKPRPFADTSRLRSKPVSATA